MVSSEAKGAGVKRTRLSSWVSGGFMTGGACPAIGAAVLLSAIFPFCIGIRMGWGAERDGRWAILIAGVSGDDDLQKGYLKELQELRSLLEGAFGFPRNQIAVLFEDPSKDPGSIQYAATRENLHAVCRDLAARVQKDDLMFVFIEGHGGYDGTNYKLNLVGPDPTGDELAVDLHSIPAHRYVVVNATNCSGGSVPALSKPGKIVIASTKNGMEKNQTRFGEFFIRSLKENIADSDKNGRVSIAEAFVYASRKVEEYYVRDGSLQTEHAVLDDNGDGRAQSKPSPENEEGLLARTTYLDKGAARDMQANLSPEQQELAREARELERQIDALKYAKGDMAEAEYENKLEALLLRLAEINAKLPK
jgi:hypothetical protein